MPIIVKKIGGDDTLTLNPNPNINKCILDIKTFIHNEWGYRPSQQQLSFDGKLLNDYDKITSLHFLTPVNEGISGKISAWPSEVQLDIIEHQFSDPYSKFTVKVVLEGLPTKTCNLDVSSSDTKTSL